jgi:signal transduction histidine kinase
VTTPTEPARVDLHGGRPVPALSGGLNALGIAVVGFWFVRNGLGLHHPVWVWVLGAVALAAWAVREYARAPRLVLVGAVVMVAAGSLVVVPTVSLMVVPVVLGVVSLGVAPRLPVWVGAVVALAAVVVVAVTAAVSGVSVQFVLGTAGGLLLGVLVGFSRRQFRIAEERAREAEREQQRAVLLADRARAARDVHDVLAHSLGGLVLQLDAVEALLEAGRVADAARRAGEARALAADGLAEARRAVRTLREDPAGQAGPAADVPGAAEAGRASRPTGDGLAALVDAHRSFGGSVVTHGDTTLTDLDAAHRAAVVQVVREALSNARRHAPGRPVALSVTRDGSAVSVTVSNPLADVGQGLRGMRERVAELGDATLEAGRTDDAFVVAVRLPVAVAAGDQR